MTGKVLVAGVGNIFFGDDGFGPEVARRLTRIGLPDSVTVGDFGIAGVHLAYELLDGYDTLVLVDTLPGAEPPGTISVLEVDAEDCGAQGSLDGHRMDPATVLGTLAGLGGEVARVLVVGCQPAAMAEGMGLSSPVEAAVDHAVQVVRGLVEARSNDEEEN